MPETFVPLISAKNQNAASPFSQLTAKPAISAGPSNPQAVGVMESSGACAAKPTVTLQRTGEIVSSIRVQCGCGQVIDLACVY